MAEVARIAVVETAYCFRQKNPSYSYFVRRCFALLSETSESLVPSCPAYLAGYTEVAALAMEAVAALAMEAVAALAMEAVAFAALKTYLASLKVVSQIKQSIVHIVVAALDQFETVASQT